MRAVGAPAHGDTRARTGLARQVATAGGVVVGGIAASVAAMLVDGHVDTLRVAACDSPFGKGGFAQHAPSMPWYGYVTAFGAVALAVVGLFLAIRARRRAILGRRIGWAVGVVLLGLVASANILFSVVMANGVLDDAKPDYTTTCPSG